MSRNLQAAGLMVAAMIMVSSNDALIKSASEDLSVSQILAIRGAMACLIFGALIKLTGRTLFPRVMLDRANLLRGGLELLATLCFVTGLALLPIAVATALVWTSPILLTVVGTLLLKEPATVSRWLAVVLGFAGVLLITRPLGADFSPAMILPLAAAFVVAVRDFVTRRIDPRVSSFSVTLTTLILVTLCGAVLACFSWNPVQATQVMKLALAAVFLAFGFHCIIKAVRMGDLSFVAPFCFTGVLVALVLGYLVWGDVPTASMLGGVALIVGTCVYLFRYERPPLPEPPEGTVP